MGPGVVFKTGFSGVCRNGVEIDERENSWKLKGKAIEIIATDVEKCLELGEMFKFIARINMRIMKSL